MYILEELEFLQNFIDETYKINIPSCMFSNKDKVKLASKYWGAANALMACYEHKDEDCLKTLHDYVDKYQIEAMLCKQLINKNHFDNATEAVDEMIQQVIFHRETDRKEIIK